MRTYQPLHCVALACIALAIPTNATAAVYVNESGRTVRCPDRYILQHGTAVRTSATRGCPSYDAPIEVPVEVVTPPPQPPLIGKRDPYQTSGLVVAGGGVGGLLLSGDGQTRLVPSYRLHLGLAVGAAEFAVRANLVPKALQLDHGSELHLYAVRASFNYRFLPGATIHPVAGLGLGSIVADPSDGEVGHAFAATARLGLEFAYPLSGGALALGIDTTGHLPFARSPAFAVDLSAMLGFGAYLDWRF